MTMRPEDMGDKPPLSEWGESAGGYSIPPQFEPDEFYRDEAKRILDVSGVSPLYVHPDLPCPRCAGSGLDVTDDGGPDEVMDFCHCEAGRVRGFSANATYYDLGPGD